ncbi:nuclear transport factor 2 family protein [Phytomonospora sp. NPDC050363]|uniref:nuclear transport factor 2 family protein n=1 Tax=Phytomonospora sp. NPDC050363 TaxID=3155642 RepID=UPI0033F3D52A
MSHHDDFLADWRTFWADPSPERAGALAHPDLVMSFPGQTEQIVGVDGWRERVAGLLARFPDLRLEPTRAASNDEGYMFISWRAAVTLGGELRTFEGVDRMLLVDGLVKETLVAFDTSIFAGATA